MLRLRGHCEQTLCRASIIEAALRQQAESRARAKAAASAREEEWKAREHAKAVLRDAIKLVKDELNAMVNSGRLSGLDALVTAVFPGTALSASAKANAFAGRGSHAMRVCVAAMVSGKPPSQVWKVMARSDNWATNRMSGSC